jgi:type IV secretory pathway TraG/TraD family ATPase VirD4
MELLSTLIVRGDRCVVVDPGGAALQHFYRSGDKILNCFDRRSEAWCVFNEIRKPFDYLRLARSIIPNGHGSDAVWNAYAQNLLAEILRALVSRGEVTTERLLYWATVATSGELEKLLAGTSASGLFEEGASRALASTKFVMTNFLLAHQHITSGSFSLRDWLSVGEGNLYLTWQEDSHDALKPLISCWVDILCNAALSLAPDRDRRLWLILDELGGLGYLNSLESALTRGRKNGLCVVACLQSVAQLDRLYGKDSSVVLRSCFRNLLVLAGSKTDPDTTETMSRCLGEREVDREVESRSKSAQGITQNTTWQRVSERLVLPSDLAEMDNLEGYLALAGDRAAQRIILTPRDLPIVAPALEVD